MHFIAIIVVITLFVSKTSAFILFFPRSYESTDGPYLSEIDSPYLLQQLAQDDSQYQLQAESKRSSEKGLVRRSAACPCLHKVCTYHCMNRRK